MTAEQQAPRTEAGQRLLDLLYNEDEDATFTAQQVIAAILAIEQEAARPLPEPQPDRLHAQIQYLRDALLDGHDHSASFIGDAFKDAPEVAERKVGALPDRPEPSLNVEAVDRLIHAAHRVQPVPVDAPGLPEYTRIQTERLRDLYDALFPLRSRLSQPPDPATAHEVK